MNFDAPFRMMRGQSLVHFFLTGQKEWQDKSPHVAVLVKPGEFSSRYYFNSIEELRYESGIVLNSSEKNNRSSYYQSDSWDGHYMVDNEGQGHPPFIDEVAALSNLILHGKLGIFGDVESYQVFYLFIASIGVLIVSIFTWQLTKSYGAGMIAGFVLASYPYFIGESHINMKDPVQAVFFAGAVWTFWQWVNEPKRWLWPLFFIGFCALALSTKWNIVFLPLIIVPWLFSIRKTQTFKNWFNFQRLSLIGLLGIFICAIFLIGTSPRSWADPMGYLIGLVNYYFGLGVGSIPQQPQGFIGIFGINFYPFLLVLLQTPEIVLLLLLVGFFHLKQVKNERILILGWLFVPVLRVMLPGAWFYNGLRQLMEIIPAVSVFAGIGFWFLQTKFPKFVVAIGVFVAICLIIPIATYHPNENAYFNSLTGGFAGASRNNLVDWSLSYGNVYKQGTDWLNKNAPKNARLAIVDGPSYAVSPLWLRSDISMSGKYFSGYEAKGEYIFKPVDHLEVTFFAKKYIENFLKPVGEIDVAGSPLLYIYKNDQKIEPKELTEFSTQQIGDWTRLDLGKDYNVVSLVLDPRRKTCGSKLTEREDVLFVPEIKANEALNMEKSYSVNEHVDNEFFFPGEKARFVYIRPRNPLSCFYNGVTTKIKYL